MTVADGCGCLLIFTLSNPLAAMIFLERITYEPLDDHEASISIGGRRIIIIPRNTSTKSPV